MCEQLPLCSYQADSNTLCNSTVKGGGARFVVLSLQDPHLVRAAGGQDRSSNLCAIPPNCGEVKTKRFPYRVPYNTVVLNPHQRRERARKKDEKQRNETNSGGKEKERCSNQPEHLYSELGPVTAVQQCQTYTLKPEEKSCQDRSTSTVNEGRSQRNEGTRGAKPTCPAATLERKETATQHIRMWEKVACRASCCAWRTNALSMYVYMYVRYVCMYGFK